MSMIAFLEMLITLLIGVVMGSFATYLFFRKQSIQSNRSVCFNCNKQLLLTSLIPIISYLKQRGKSTCCKKQIPIAYFFVELSVASLFICTYIMTTFGYTLFYWYLPITFLLYIFAVYDYLKGELPIKWSITGIIYVIILSFFTSISLVTIVKGLLLGATFFLLQILISNKKWVGWGDVYYGALLGSIFGIKKMLVVLFFTYTIGAIYGVYHLLSKKGKMGDKVALGIFLSTGAYITLLYGNQILDWYVLVARL